MTEPVAPERPQDPGAAPSYATMPATAQAPKKKSFNWTRILISLGVIVVLAVGYQVVKHVTGDPDVAKVGACMAGQSGDSLKVVDCGAKADWKVVGKVNDVKKPQTDEDSAKACAQWPTTAASFWKGENGGTGYILCLAEAK